MHVRQINQNITYPQISVKRIFYYFFINFIIFSILLRQYFRGHVVIGCQQQDSNLRPLAYETRALPLSYADYFLSINYTIISLNIRN